ncbi:MAG: TldD/PmbA family protein [Bdellovibrionota bacterium]|nr:TldD/PmbA family protein [Bdellovibrionota bacterium]
MTTHIETISKETLGELLKTGIKEGSVSTSITNFDELVFENDSFTLLRSADENALNLTALNEGKKGSFSMNQLNPQGLKAAVEKTAEMAAAAKEDSAFAMAPGQKKMNFDHGPKVADREAMRDLITDFVQKTKEQYPEIGLRSVTVKFLEGRTHFENSNGVEANIRKGYYTFSALFNAQKGDNSSSMNYDGLSFTDFNLDLLSEEKFGKVFADTIAHLDAKKYGKNHTGKAIFMPSCWNTFIQFGLAHLSTGQLVAQTSRLEGRRGEKVASPLFHLESRPQDSLFANPNFLTSDGIETENQVIFDQGVLKTYLLDLYGKNKLNEEKVSNFSSRLYMPKGQSSLDEMIKGIDEGILIGRFSGGYPNANGDFSGIAKNSFLIKNGKIEMALSETMISGNVFDVYEKIYATSKEVYENGTCHLPYVASDGITIS